MANFTREGVLGTMKEAADRMGLDLEDLQEMINDVLEDCAGKSQKLKEAIEAGDSATIKAVAHDIKGSTANYGLPEPSNIALNIEKNSANVPDGLADELINQIAELAKLNLAEAG